MEITERKAGTCVWSAWQGGWTPAPRTFAYRLHQIIDGGERHLVVDGATLDYISSAGLRVLLVAAKRLKAVDGRIVLSRSSPISWRSSRSPGSSPFFRSMPTPSKPRSRCSRARAKRKLDLAGRSRHRSA